MRRIVCALVLAVALAGPALAVEPAERLADPVQEARARAVSKVLRCLVCQNESIDESGADLAHDIRVLLRQRIAAGDTDQQAIDYVVARYGQFVLLKPPFEPATYALWFAPAVLVFVGLGAILWRTRRRRGAVALSPAPLSEDERRRLEPLLRDDDR